VELVSHPDLVRLHPTGNHPEQGARLAVLHERFPNYVTAEAAAVDDVLRCHDEAYVMRLRGLAHPTWLDHDTMASETSFEAALLAAGAAIDAAVRGGFALVRPPGHHALRTRAMGFCLFNNVVVAALAARRLLGIERVAIVDFDVHHGNGTQALVQGDPSILYVSLHQWPFYPGTGGPEEQGETLLNIPLNAGAGDREYAAAFAGSVEPSVRAFEPELVLVSAGFDAHAEDPLADMELTADGFRELACRCTALGPRVAAVLEGGYNLAALPELFGAALEGFVSS
jgi:acetoin utilization deacetylase AcuC-like enzyme